MTSVEIVFNLVIAALLSGLVGIDRELRKRDAGLRTHMLVGLGAAVFSIIGLQVGEDPSRVAAQVVTGIGFLGAGTIFRAGNSVRGLTTAAGLWTVAGIGVATGMGLYVIAITGTILGWVIIHSLLPVSERLDRDADGVE